MTETAIFAAGCFWGVEQAFRRVPGVVNVTVGYSGGDAANPTYEQVCTGTTGHAEVARVEYDPEKVGYEHLLKVFFSIHNPTQVNRQGPDIGTQYRTAIFTLNGEQEQAARGAVRQLDEARWFPKPVATQVLPAGPFWPAEDYHQDYFGKRGGGACHI